VWVRTSTFRVAIGVFVGLTLPHDRFCKHFLRPRGGYRLSSTLSWLVLHHVRMASSYEEPSTPLWNLLLYRTFFYPLRSFIIILLRPYSFEQPLDGPLIPFSNELPGMAVYVSGFVGSLVFKLLSPLLVICECVP